VNPVNYFSGSHKTKYVLSMYIFVIFVDKQRDQCFFTMILNLDIKTKFGFTSMFHLKLRTKLLNNNSNNNIYM